MEEERALIEISVRVYDDDDLLGLVLEDDEDPEEELEEKLAEMGHYVVNDLDGFFSVYSGFDDEDEDDIRDSARERDLLVFADGSVFWQDGEKLIEGMGEVMDHESFSDEAALSGAEVIE